MGIFSKIFGRAGRKTTIVREDDDFGRSQEYGHIARLANPCNAGGVWVCEGGHETLLYHNRGSSHPLGQIQCSTCPRLFVDSPNCTATPVIKKQSKDTVMWALQHCTPVDAKDCGRLCSFCGMSHRSTSASFMGACDACLRQPSTKDVYFFLGDNRSYRRNPIKAVHDCRIGRIEPQSTHIPIVRGGTAMTPRPKGRQQKQWPAAQPEQHRSAHHQQSEPPVEARGRREAGRYDSAQQQSRDFKPISSAPHPRQPSRQEYQAYNPAIGNVQYQQRPRF